LDALPRRGRIGIAEGGDLPLGDDLGGVLLGRAHVGDLVGGALLGGGGRRLVGHNGAPTPALSGCLTSASSPGMITWRAPGTPYSYGPPTTRGISSKLKTGGGEETCHSIVFARHGFGPAFGP